MSSYKKTIIIVGTITCLFLMFILAGKNSPVWRHFNTTPTTQPRHRPYLIEGSPKAPTNNKTHKSKGLFQIPNLWYLHDRFFKRTEGTLCNNTCNHPHCRAKTAKEWYEMFRNGTMKGVPLYGETEYIYQWELDYLKDPPLTDVNKLPHLGKSKIYYQDSKKEKSDTRPGNVIVLTKNVAATFRVELLDGYGRHRVKGGDEVRAWLTGNDNNGKEVAATARVKDYGNGSYDVIATPKWTGTAQLHVSVVYPREYMRAVFHHQRIGAYRFVFAKFRRKKVEEVTLCYGTPNIPGRPCLCNMTRWNGLPYYCGKPLDSRLTCDDRPLMGGMSALDIHDLTPAEKIMSRDGSRFPRKAQISYNVKMDIVGESEDSTLPPCINASRATSWTMTSPRGVWSLSSGGNVWNSLVCREPPMTKKWAQKCLKSTTIWMIGDSNLRKMVENIRYILGCNVNDHDSWKWPLFSSCRNTKYNTTVYFRPHEYPLYLGNMWIEFLNNGATTDTLSSIPSTGDHIVVVHYYLHLSSSHLSVLHQRLIALKEAISKLLIRNPKTLIVIRGPHISAIDWTRNHMFGGDVIGSRIRDMHLEIFHDLQDKIVFLDAWDMSISSENLNLHPPEYFYTASWRTILSYKCN